MQRIAALYEQHGQRLSIATIDQDATIVESHQRAAFDHYQGGRGYQPIARLEAVWKVFWLPTQASRTKPWPRAA